MAKARNQGPYPAIRYLPGGDADPVDEARCKESQQEAEKNCGGKRGQGEGWSEHNLPSTHMRIWKTLGPLNPMSSGGGLQGISESKETMTGRGQRGCVLTTGSAQGDKDFSALAFLCEQERREVTAGLKVRFVCLCGPI